MHGQMIMPLIINTHQHLEMVKSTSSGASNRTENNFGHQQDKPFARFGKMALKLVMSLFEANRPAKPDRRITK
jgi:cytosine/adenosine deaminase-related metal-dependent hydrolase